MLMPKYQPVIHTAILSLFSLYLIACSGGGSGSDATFSDPANKAGAALEEQLSISALARSSITGQPTRSAHSLDPLEIVVSLTNGKDRPVANKIVSMSTTLGLLDSQSGNALTNDDGEVVALLEVSNAQPGSAGTITVSHLDTSFDLVFEVSLAPVSLGSSLNGVFSQGQLGLSASIIPNDGQALISLNILGDNGEVIDQTLTPIFSSPCLNAEPPLASVSLARSPTKGEIIGTYTASGCSGTELLKASFAELGGHEAEAQLEILPPEAASISFLQTQHTTIGLKGAPGNSLSDSTRISFNVTNSNGEIAPNIAVSFTLSNPSADVRLSKASSVTNAQGQVSVTLSAGNLPTVARVLATAETDAGALTAFSPDILVTNGIPAQRSFSLTADTLNPGGDINDGIIANVSVSVGDRLNNPVTDGTVVFFHTEYGSIDANCTTINRACSVEWRSQAPRTPLFSSFDDENGSAAFVRTLDNTRCSNGTLGQPCPDTLGHPIGARSTVMAYTLGNEDFNDANANGLFDVGESFADLPEVFLDDNEDGEFGNLGTQGSCQPHCPRPGGNEETFVDRNNDGIYNAGNGVYNGSLCSEDALTAGHCSTEQVAVSDSTTLLISGSLAYGAFFNRSDRSASPLRSVSVGSSNRSVLFYLSDRYNGKLPRGSSVRIASSDCPLEGKTDYIVANTNSPGPSVFPFIIARGNSKIASSGLITATVDVPATSGTASSTVFTLACSVDACGIQPSPAFCLESD